jgi:hypothetical protein
MQQQPPGATSATSAAEEGVPPPGVELELEPEPEPEPEPAMPTGRDDAHRPLLMDADEEEGRPGATPAASPLPLGGDDFPDEAVAIVCHSLGPRELGRLACVSRRFTECTLTEPGSEGGAGGVRLSPIEEGARLRLAAGAGTGGGPAKRGQPTWLRALWYAEYRLAFTSCGPRVTLSEDGASCMVAACARLLAVCVPPPAVSTCYERRWCCCYCCCSGAVYL